MQCDPHCSEYTPCLSTCPVETCDNILDQSESQRLCSRDTCVEGCQLKPCPADEIYFNSTYGECVPKSVCKHVCLEVNGVTYLEGGIMSSDDCHTCRCIRGKELCSGVPCSPTTISPVTFVPTTFPPTTVGEPYKDSEDLCRSGWSQWFNQDRLDAAGPEETPQRLVKEPNAHGTGGLVNTKCDPIVPHIDFPGDCHKFLHCEPSGVDGSWKYAEKTCGISMLFNPVHMVCDWPDSVKAIKPECGESASLVQAPVKTKAPIKKDKYLKTNDAEPMPSQMLLCNLVPSTATCSWEFIKKIECRTVGTHLTPKQTGEDVECSLEKGLICVGPCHDYEIRVMCDCGDEIELFTLPTTVPQVISYQHEGTPQRIVQLPTTRRPTEARDDRCPVGKIWSDCAVPCGKSCHHYGTLLRTVGRCGPTSFDCEEGCVEESLAALSCRPGQLWRDKKICVAREDCTCMSKMGDLVKVVYLLFLFI